MSLPKEGDSAALIYSVDGVLIPSTQSHGNRAHVFEITDLLMTPFGATLACGAVAIGLGVKAVTSAAAKRWECWYSARRGSRQRQGRGVHAAPSGGRPGGGWRENVALADASSRRNRWDLLASKVFTSTRDQ